MRLCNPEPTFTEVEFTGKKSTPLTPERKKKKKPDLLRATEMVKWKPGKAVTPCIILSRGRNFSLWLFKFALRSVQPYFLQKPGYQKPWENSRDEARCRSQNSGGAHGSWLLGVTHGSTGTWRLQPAEGVQSRQKRSCQNSNNNKDPMSF